MIFGIFFSRELFFFSVILFFFSDIVFLQVFFQKKIFHFLGGAGEIDTILSR